MEQLSLWFSLHPHLAGLSVFLISLAESLAVVGLLVPGVAMMFAAGTLIGTGALEFAPICAWAVAGAIAGDGLSFWLGRHFRETLPGFRPFRSHPALLERGEAFFHRYGGRSVIFGRFVGPIRAVIPLVAGMMAMPARRFLVVNVASALLWAPAYLVPGILFGASLDIASQVTRRLVVLLILLVSGLWFTAWLTKHLYLLLQPHAHRVILYTFDLCNRHPLLGRFTAPLIDPQQRDYPGLMVWAVMLLGLSLLLSPLVGLDLMPLSLQALRTPWSDHGLTLVKALGQERGFGILGAVVALWLAVQQRNVALAHWLAALAFAFGLDHSARLLLDSRSPIDGPTLVGTVGYGFLAVLMAEDLDRKHWRWLVYAGAAVLAGSLGFSSLYFGSITLSAVALTGMIALIWLILLGVAYRRHRGVRAPRYGLGWVAAITLAGLLLVENRAHSLADFEHPLIPQTLEREEWVRTEWADLPGRRSQMFGAPSQVLDLQWAATPTGLRTALIAAGWQDAVPLTWSTALHGLSPSVTLDQLPVLPHFNQSFIDQLRMIKRAADGKHWVILRFWDSGHRLRDTAETIWLGSCGLMEERQLLWNARYLRQLNTGAETVHQIAGEIASANVPYHVAHLEAGEHSAWLLWAPAAARDNASP